MKKAKQEKLEPVVDGPVKNPKKRGRKPKKKEPVKQEGDMDIQEKIECCEKHTTSLNARALLITIII